MYHLKKFEEYTGHNVSEMKLILEIGGGYGSMRRLVSRLGFRGMYVIFDLPHLIALQKYYLSSLNLANETTFIDDIDELGLYRRPDGKGMMIATWSLSECPIPLRQKIERFFPFFDHFLFAYQERFADIDNVEYFDLWSMAMIGSMRWEESIKHLPGHRYLFISLRVTGAR